MFVYIAVWNLLSNTLTDSVEGCCEMKVQNININEEDPVKNKAVDKLPVKMVRIIDKLLIVIN